MDTLQVLYCTDRSTDFQYVSGKVSYNYTERRSFYEPCASENGSPMALNLWQTVQVLPLTPKDQTSKQMTAAGLKKLITDFYNEVWGKGNLDFADQVFHPDYIRHDLRQGAPLPGPGGQKKIAGDFRSAFPDLTIHIDLIFAAEDFVAARWTMSGTHRGPWGTIAPTGKKATFSGVNLFRMEEGKVKEIWNHRDDLGLFEQLGVKVYAGSKQ